MLVRSTCSGVSAGTELAVYRGTLGNLHTKRWGYWNEYPIRPGYELVGSVSACGSAVTGIRMGDRVACHAPHGTIALVQASDCVVVPDGLSDEEATFAMLGATTAHGIRRARIGYGDTVAILGLGVVGFLAADHALHAGAADVIVCDPKAWKRELARLRGFEDPLDPADSTFDEEIAERTQGRGADVVVEASGSPAAVDAALRTVAVGGRVLLQGTINKPVQIHFSDYAMHKEVTIVCTWGKGSGAGSGVRWTRQENHTLAMRLLEAGVLRTTGLVSHRFSFARVADMYREIDEGELDYLQIILTY